MKPKEFAFEPKTLGEHIKSRRISKNLTQGEAARILEVNAWTVLNWEKGHTKPRVESMPSILQFLGYDPLKGPKTLSERMVVKRRGMGWTIKKAARRFGVDAGTWSGWERGTSVPQLRYAALLDNFLAKGLS